MMLSYKERGFTLLEILIVVMIIGILASVVTASVQEGRKKARDAQRISDIGQIQVAVRLYRDANGTTDLADKPSGEEIDGTSDIQSLIESYLPDTIADPLNTGEYKYYYDSDYNCGGTDRTVVLARMEQTDSANYEAICGVTSPSDLGNGVTPDASLTYIQILK